MACSTIDAAEADALAADFNRSFGGAEVPAWRAGARSAVAVSVRRAARGGRRAPPEEALGDDVWAHQPRGEGCAELRRLASEIEMWLFDHAVNRGAPCARRRRSSALCGFGEAVRAMPRCPDGGGLDRGR